MPNIPTIVTTNLSIPIEVIVVHIIEVICCCYYYYYYYNLLFVILVLILIFQAAPRDLFSPVFNIAVKCCNDSINCSFGESALVCRHNKSDIDQIYITADLHTDFGYNDAISVPAGLCGLVTILVL